MKKQYKSVLMFKREAPDIRPVCPMVNPDLVAATFALGRQGSEVFVLVISVTFFLNQIF